MLERKRDLGKESSAIAERERLIIIIRLILRRSLLPSLVDVLGGLVGDGLLVGGALRYACGDIGINLSIALSSLEVDTLLLGELLEAGALPFGQPALMIGLRTGVLRVEVLGVADSPLSLLGRHEDLCASLGLLNDVLGLLLLALLWHAVFDQLLCGLLVILDANRHFLL